MSRPWPAGQRERADFPRFGLLQFARRFPAETSKRELKVVGDVAHELVVADVLDGLPWAEQVSDFHCVTTWSRRAVRWGGVRFIDFYERVIAPQVQPLADARTFILRGQDGARTTMLLEDLLAPDVLIATTLDGAPLPVEHGAPMRLVAPAHYGYKSVKHLSRIEIRTDESRFRPAAFRFMDHPRARVVHEERGRGLPGWLLRYLYRPLVAPTVRHSHERWRITEMHKPNDPDFAARIRASFDKQQAMALIGASMPVIEPGYTEIHLHCRPEVTQQHGYVHGGVVGMIADSAAGYAANTLTSADTGVLTVEYKMNLLAPAEGQLLIAEGSVVRYGRTLIVTKAEVFAVKDGKKTLCALMQQTIMALHGKKEKTETKE